MSEQNLADWLRAAKEGVKAVTEARDAGYTIYAETCPQYLEFTNEVYKREDGRNFVCSPPMKGEESREALWEAINRGDIATIATDHCPFNRFEKDWGKDDFTKIPNGCAGIENMYPYMLSAANTGKISNFTTDKNISDNETTDTSCRHQPYRGNFIRIHLRQRKGKLVAISGMHKHHRIPRLSHSNIHQSLGQTRLTISGRLIPHYDAQKSLGRS